MIASLWHNSVNLEPMKSLFIVSFLCFVFLPGRAATVDEKPSVTPAPLLAAAPTAEAKKPSLEDLFGIKPGRPNNIRGLGNAWRDAILTGGPR